MTKQLLVERIKDPRIFRWMLLQSSVVWKEMLTSEQYVSRDDVLTPCKLYNFYDENDPTGIYYYVLRDMSIPIPETDDAVALLTCNIVCSCELLIRESWKRVGGDLKTVLSGCIGSVYTLPQHRSKGYANHLITALDKVSLELLGADGFISLYSEVGTYYERFNYYSYPVSVSRFPASTSCAQVPGIKPLKFNEFESLIGQYKESLEAYICSREHSKTVVSIIPKPEMIEWHHIRSRYISKVLYDRLPDIFGFQLDDSFVIISHDYGDRYLTIYMIYATALPRLFALLRQVSEEARNIGFKNVHVWSNQLYEYNLKDSTSEDKTKIDDYVREELNGETGLENESLSALKTLDGSFADWEGNHKWPWF